MASKLKQILSAQVLHEGNQAWRNKMGERKGSKLGLLMSIDNL
jgi:hypothetical protein